MKERVYRKMMLKRALNRPNEARREIAKELGPAMVELMQLTAHPTLDAFLKQAKELEKNEQIY